MRIWKTLVNPVPQAQCHALLGNEDLMAELASTHFDAAIVDFVYNECGLALAQHLGVPTVGFWASSPAGLHMEFTTMDAPASEWDQVQDLC
jgi:hypothetical protein